jgi:isopentenyl-diphosphate delta-isomerase
VTIVLPVDPERAQRMTDISRRKADHLDLTIRGDVSFKHKTTLFEDIQLVHDALPELAFDEIDLSTRVLGKRLRAPLLIAAMTGGTERAEQINRELASIAEECGYAFGLGSQRAMHKRPNSASTYRVREVAPTTLLLGNVGIVQAHAMQLDEIGALVSGVGADALCVHMNPAMEVIQDDGDRDFRGGLDTLAELVRSLGVPVVAKETGCGISAEVARRLRAAGVRHVDVSGAGGTSWVAVEAQRASEERKPLGQSFWDWGIPTAASVALCAAEGFETIFATGGVQNGLDVAKAIVLGASTAGIARPVLQALDSGGRQGAVNYLKSIETELRTAMLLVGAADLAALKRVPRVIMGELRDWIEQLGRPRPASHGGTTF